MEERLLVWHNVSSLYVRYAHSPCLFLESPAVSCRRTTSRCDHPEAHSRIRLSMQYDFESPSPDWEMQWREPLDMNPSLCR